MALLVLTLIAGALRFAALDRPAIWGDESATAGRIIGTHEELLDQLAEGTFTPMHYQLGWWIAQGMPYWGTISESGNRQIFNPTHRLIEGGVTMTPFFMRLVPAIAGTLMVPAIYFLSRQLFGPRVSLLAAAVCCFSAYLLIYSRDAKMYMPFWLLCTLNVACLLWWLRVRTWTAWLCWVAAGCAMIGFHSLGLIVVVVNVVIWITAPRQHWSGLWKLALLIFWPLLLAVAGIYELLRKRFDLMVWWRFRDVLRYPVTMWPRFHFPTILLFAAGLYVIVLGRQFYVESFNERFNRVVSDDGVFQTDVNGTGWVGPYNAGRKFGSLALYTTSAYLTGWEWPRNKEDERVDDQASVNPRTLKLLKAAVVTMLVVFAIGFFPWRRIFSPAKARLDRIVQDGVVDSRYARRRTLWIGFWLIVPAFALYSQSVAKPAFVLDAISAFALNSPAAIEWPRLPRAEKETDKFDFYASSATWQPFGEAFGKSWTQFVEQFKAEDALNVTRLIVLGVFIAAILTAIVWRRKAIGGTSLRLSIAFVVVVLLCALLTLAPRFPDKSVWMPRYVGVVYPAFAIAVAVLIARLPGTWLRAGALLLFVGVNVGQFYARVFTPSEPPTDRFVADMVRSHESDNAFRAYVAFRHRGAEPGNGTFPSSPASYYLWLGTRHPGFRAADVRWGRHPRELRIWNVIDPTAIARDVERSDKIERFVIWSSFDWDKAETTDPVAEKLAGRFRRVSDEVTPVYDHWRWMHLYNARRREYVRVGT